MRRLCSAKTNPDQVKGLKESRKKKSEGTILGKEYNASEASNLLGRYSHTLGKGHLSDLKWC